MLKCSGTAGLSPVPKRSIVEAASSGYIQAHGCLGGGGSFAWSMAWSQAILSKWQFFPQWRRVFSWVQLLLISLPSSVNVGTSAQSHSAWWSRSLAVQGCSVRMLCKNPVGASLSHRTGVPYSRELLPCRIVPHEDIQWQKERVPFPPWMNAQV